MDGQPRVLSGPFAGRYTIERELGRGGTATVYRALDKRSNRAVAIKILKPELAQSIGSGRFLREIKLTAKLEHPHIIPVLDSGEHLGNLYFVLPLMEKGTLRERMARERQLSIDVAVGITRTIADALDYAHGQGLVHRDVKPENILFSDKDVCLADFGIARAIERSLDDPTTSTGIVRGTPAYMSPEQASGEHNYDGRSDIYSLACVLYEMIAGMPAFVGPTAKSVMAQRLLHPPRAITIYRPNIRPALEAAIQRALEVTPADRFATAGEFSQALGTAITSGDGAIDSPRATNGSPPPGKEGKEKKGLGMLQVRNAVAASLIAAVVMAGGFAAWRNQGGGAFGFLAPRPDTSKVVILPFEGDISAPREQAYDMLQQGFARWSGVIVVDRFAMRKARGSEAPVEDDEHAKSVALSVGAGRYVRSRITKVGGELRLWAALYNWADGARLSEGAIPLSTRLEGADSSIGRLADGLLLRRRDNLAPGSKVLPAVQTFENAMRAVDAFSLKRADTLLLAAVEQDPGYGRAALWLAQVRNWKLEPTSRWQTWAERASASSGLSKHEATIARALVAMSQGNFPASCAAFDSLRALDERDFAAWYGLGQCSRQDDIVIRDRRSPSGWRFRSSSHRATRSYARALQLAPALHQTFESHAYVQLRDLLYSRRSTLRPGKALPPDTGQFLAYAGWAGDSLVHIPYPTDVIRRGGVRNDSRVRQAALDHQRELFQDIARSWSAALPKSPGTREAVAISLEAVGDVRAIDTLRAGRALALDSELRTRLAIEEVLMRVGFGRRDTVHGIAAIALADSLLSASVRPSSEEAAALAPIAALLGRCRLASGLAARGVNEAHATLAGQPLVVVAAAESLTVLSAMGCRTPSDSAGIRALLDDVAQSGSRDGLEYSLFGRAVTLTYPLDASRVARLAQSSGDYVLQVQAASMRNDVAAVRSVLDSKLRVRAPADVSPDAVYPEARAWVQLGEAARARMWLDPVLGRVGWLELLLNDPINTASLLRSAALRAELAYAAGDSRGARQWAGLVGLLWAKADPEVRPLAQRMSQIARRR